MNNTQFVRVSVFKHIRSHKYINSITPLLRMPFTVQDKEHYVTTRHSLHCHFSITMLHNAVYLIIILKYDVLLYTDMS